MYLHIIFFFSLSISQVEGGKSFAASGVAQYGGSQGRQYVSETDYSETGFGGKLSQSHCEDL